MPSWRKSPPELIAFFDKVLPDDPRVDRRKMFGYPCAFTTGGQMFIGLHQENLIVRLAEADRAKLLKEPGASIFEPMPGRQMKEYVSLPQAMLSGDPSKTRPWVVRALDYAASLPPKKPKGAKPKTGASAKKAAPKRSTKNKA
ncbi:MAG: TfoX/Sxy family protein [Alphaproteobacteria bacterium]|nr:TfoX/Sxy family protein [Alphaproteobacteria bacterium]